MNELPRIIRNWDAYRREDGLIDLREVYLVTYGSDQAALAYLKGHPPVLDPTLAIEAILRAHAVHNQSR